jgi:hypothetical protein
MTRVALVAAAAALVASLSSEAASAGPAASLLEAARRMRTPNDFLASLSVDGYALLVSSDAQFRGSVSADTPRLLLGDTRTGTLFAFNQGVNVVEMIEFDGRVYVPHALEFPAIVDLSGAVVSRDGWAPSVVIDDPRRLRACPSCHIGRDLPPGETPPAELFRPNWHEYSRWPDAIVPTDGGRQPQAILSALERFADGNGKRGVYGALPQALAFPRGTPYATDLPFYGERHFSLGTSFFSTAVFRANYRRIAQQLFGAKGFGAYESAFFDWSSADWEKRLPAAERAAAPAELSRIAADFRGRYASLQARELARIQANYPGLTPEEIAEVSSRDHEHELSELRLKMIYMAQKLGLGDRLSSWSTAYHGSYPEVPLMGHDGSYIDKEWAQWALWRYRPSCGVRSLLSSCKKTICDLSNISFFPDETPSRR